MKRLFRLSFKNRVFFGCLLAALIPLLFSSAVMTRLFTASVNRQMEAEGNRQLAEASQKLTQLLENCEKVCENLTEDGSAARAMVEKDALDQQKDLYLSLYQAVQEIYSNARISIYDSGGLLRFTTDSLPRNKRLPLHWGILRKAKETEGIAYYRTDTYLAAANKDILMQGAYSLEDSRGVRTGYVVLDFYRENFDNLFNGFYSSGNTLLVLDSHERPVYCSKEEYGEKETGSLLAREINGQEESVRYLWTKEPFSGFSVFLKCTGPISLGAVRTMRTVSALLSALGLILSLIISAALSKGLAQPVSQLDKAMAKVKKGDLSIRIHTSRQDELGRLTESFNQMTVDLQKHIEDAVQKQKDLNEAALKLYQTQLNPHFLYNTLDTIKWNAKINQIPEIAVLAENLAVILRKSISSHPFITLKEELETIESYIQIQKIRFTGRFLYETEIPDQLEECMVPRMILQPLVENAVIHGLEGCENGYICIFAALKDGILSISVTDDGCGMDQEALDWINEDNPVKKEGHLGLYNVIRILKIYYGQEYGIRAESGTDGTAVTLRMPVKKEKNDV